MAITDYHRAIFTYLEAYRREVPEAGLTYSLRQKNKVGRPRNVFLFTGDDKYISIGLYGPISNNNKTRTISFYATYDPVSDRIKTCTLAIVFSDQHLADQEEIYRAIIQQIGPDQFKEYSHNRFEHSYTGADWQANLATYLQQHKPIIDKAIQQAGATETFNIPQEKLEADIIIANQPTPTPVQPVVKPPGKYTWIPFYRELCVKLLHYTTEKLIRVTKQVLKAEKLVGLVDKDADGNKMDLTVIDPYTVLSFIRICADDKRAILFNQLTYQLGLNCSVPADWDGLYTDRNQWIWLFGYADERAPNDIDKLWELYKQVEQDDVSEDLFNQVLAIKKLSKSKLTEGLFSQYPYAYFPLNSKTKEWLKKRKLPHHFSTYAEYISLMDTVEQYDSRPFYELSEEAYKESQPDNELTEPMPLPDSNHPKNIILYGPPGTGKTYGTIDLAVDIVDGQKGKHPANKVRFDQLRKEGQIEFVTFHQNYSYEDFVTGLKPDVDGEDLKFQRTYGVLYKMAKKARDNYEASVANVTSTVLRPFQEVFDEFIRPLEEKDWHIPVTMATGKVFNLTELSDKSVDFIKDNGGYDHSLSIDTLKRLYDGVIDRTQGLWYYYKPVIQLLRELGTERPTVSDRLHNYVLIIDEINRANMSRVFGELITLLEDDKRLGADNELTVTLSSGESFVLPPNLYLIGTMNTADKSLALLDIALRRRFEFQYTKPDPTLLGSPAKEILTKLNKAIRDEHKPADFLIGHAYFMGKAASQLPDVFNNRVIPLLMEYFNGKSATVINVLKRAGVIAEVDSITDEIKVSHVE